MRFLSRRRGSASVSAAPAIDRKRNPERLRRAVAAFAGNLDFVEALEERRLFASATDVALSISGLPTPTVNAGQTIDYTVTVRNTGTDFAGGVTMTDVMPANTQFVRVQQIGTNFFNVQNPSAANGQTLTATIGQLNSSTAQTFVITVRVLPATAAGTVITDTGNVTVDPMLTTDLDPTDNSGTVNTVVNTQADVAVTKTGPAGLVIAGTDITYTLSITNNGPSDAQNTVMTDIVPAMTSFVSATQLTGPTFTVTSTPPVGQAGTYSASIAALPSGQTATFSYVVHLASSAPLGQTVFNTMTGSTTTFDPARANNFSTANNDIDTQADIEIFSDSDKVNKTIEGTFFPYTMTIYNLGPSDADTATFAWQTPIGNGGMGPRYGVYINNGPVVQLVSGPGFTVSIPARPPERGVISGTIPVLPAGVATTYKFTVGTAEQQDLVQDTTAGSVTPIPIRPTTPPPTICTCTTLPWWWIRCRTFRPTPASPPALC